MRELVHAIDTHMEMVDLEVTNNLHFEEGQGQTLATTNQSGARPPTKSMKSLKFHLPNHLLDLHVLCRVYLLFI